MTKYVAFLRGINVGGRIIKMTDLKDCFEKAGFKNVSTLLQTGNIIFESELKATELKRKIEAILTKTFSYPAKVQVYNLEKLAEIIKQYPFEARDGYHNYVIFLENGLERELAQEPVDMNAQLEKVEAGKGVVYWQVERGQTLKSAFAKHLSKPKYKDFNTNRNINTLQKLL